MELLHRPESEEPNDGFECWNHSIQDESIETRLRFLTANFAAQLGEIRKQLADIRLEIQERHRALLDELQAGLDTFELQVPPAHLRAKPTAIGRQKRPITQGGAIESSEGRKPNVTAQIPGNRNLLAVRSGMRACGLDMHIGPIQRDVLLRLAQGQDTTRIAEETRVAAALVRSMKCRFPQLIEKIRQGFVTG